MIIQLQSEHISLLWPKIKHAIKTVEKIEDENFLNHALKNLLSGYFQAWITYKIEESKQVIYAISITSIYQDKFFEFSGLYINYVYAFKKIDSQLRDETMKAFFDYARLCECQEITTDSNSKAVEKILSSYGFNKKTKYKLSI